MESLGQRIARLRREHGLSQGALGDLCGWEKGQARIGNYERDLREPNITDLRLLAKALEVSLMEIIEGSDTPSANPSTAGISPPRDDYTLIPPYVALDPSSNENAKGHVEIKGSLAFKRDWLAQMALRQQNLHVVYFHGQSMGPTIRDGDVVLVDQSQMIPQDGRIYVIRMHGGELIIKRMTQAITGGWIIRSDNDDKRSFPDQSINESEIKLFQIIGRVVWHGGAL